MWKVNGEGFGHSRPEIPCRGPIRALIALNGVKLNNLSRLFSISPSLSLIPFFPPSLPSSGRHNRLVFPLHPLSIPLPPPSFFLPPSSRPPRPPPLPPASPCFVLFLSASFFFCFTFTPSFNVIFFPPHFFHAFVFSEFNFPSSVFCCCSVYDIFDTVFYSSTWLGYLSHRIMVYQCFINFFFHSLSCSVYFCI